MEQIHIFMFIFFGFQIFLYGGMNRVEALDATSDKEALLQFQSMVYDPQNALSQWNSTSSHCTWFGVTCNNEDRVQSVLLVGLGLSGMISPRLSNLTSLEVINFFNNSFYGPIPTEFSRLTILQNITLAKNSISGTIPADLSQCYNLKEISLQSNQLTGHLPPELGHLQKLQHLDISVNNLSGAIPPSFGNLSSLTYLALARNQFFGNIPHELGDLQNLRILQLVENQLTGNIPSSIFNMPSLFFLSLAYNNLSGELPTGIGPSLEQIFLSHNNLEGLIPRSLSNALQIEQLDLSSNNFQGTIPLFGSMKNLVILHLGENNLSSTTEMNLHAFQSLTNCTKLEILFLNSNQLSGKLPSSVANLSTHLQEFCVDGNFLTGSLPQGFEKFQNLTAFSIYRNFFTGEVPGSIGKLHQLNRFMVQQNMFSGQIPDMFGNLTQLYFLTMGYNQFSGRIPPSIGKCQHLVTLGLGQNRLNGSIPKEIFGLSSLSNLYLTKNALTGSLSRDVGGLTQLEVMDVSDNLLTGHIPTTIGACLSLRNLSMARNQLNGLIPPEPVGKLLGLESLDLSSNALSGPIPQDLENLRFLRELNLSFNNLEGQVPTKRVFMKLSSDSLQGNDKLCGSDQEAAERLRLLMCKTGRKSNTHLLLKIIIPVAVSIVLVCAIFFVLALIFHQKKKRNKGSCLPPVKGSPQLISYSEIWHATNGFAAENLLGKGGFASVYKGEFGTGENAVYTTMAIKVLDLQLSKACKSFNVECEALRNIRHRNLVKVFSSCSSIDHKGAEFKALIMEFMANGILDKWLYPEDEESCETLTLIQRLNIAIDVASAMDYLHHDCDPPIVHCDLKPRNVLLDDNMGAHVGDFGLARFVSQNPSQEESSTMGLKGSIGYIAPEYGLGGTVSTKGDVYSFGILLLEIFMAKRANDEMFQEGLNLNKFESAVHENHVLRLLDPRLLKDNEYSESIHDSSSNSSSNWNSRTEECLAALVRIGLSCTAHSPKDRLTMRETLTKLQDIKSFMQNY